MWMHLKRTWSLWTKLVFFSGLIILAGVAPIRSVKAAHMMNNVPGVIIPQTIFDRMEKSADPKEEGVQIGLELIDGRSKICRSMGFTSWQSVGRALFRAWFRKAVCRKDGCVELTLDYLD